MLLVASVVGQNAQANCPTAVDDWASRCEERSGLRVAPAFCPAGLVIFEVQGEGADPIRIEVGEADRGLETIGGYGVSAVGDFPDWYGVGSDIRVPFDAVMSCLAADDELRLPEGEVQVSGGRDRPGPSGHRDGVPARPESPPLPWWPLAQALLVIGVLAGCASFVERARLLRIGLFLMGLVSASYAIGLALHPVAFLHQNGQGPWWVTYAMCIESEHGPGYRELFEWVAAQSPGQPDLAIFAFHGLLGALWPMWAWLTVRGIGGDRWLATAAAVVVALDPLVGRVVHSESYFATMTSLLFPAAAVLAVGSRFASKWRWALPLATLTAGLLIAQSARVHPLGWLPAAFVPLVVLVSDGTFRSRLTQTVLVGLGIAIVAGLGTADHIAGVMSSSLGQQWAPRLSIQSMTQWAMGVVWYGLGWTAFLVVFSRRKTRAGIYGLLLCLVVCTAAATNLVPHSSPTIVAALMYLHLPVAFTLALAGVRELGTSSMQRTLLAILVVIVGLTWQSTRRRTYTELPTDAMEAQFLIENRHLLPNESSVHYLAAQGAQRRVFLPLYGECSEDSPHALRGGFDDRPIAAGDFYLRSSICFTDAGQAVCEDIEAAWRFEELSSASLPARASMQDLDYNSETIDVALLRVLEPIVPPDPAQGQDQDTE